MQPSELCFEWEWFRSILMRIGREMVGQVMAQVWAAVVFVRLSRRVSRARFTVSRTRVQVGLQHARNKNRSRLVTWHPATCTKIKQG